MRGLQSGNRLPQLTEFKLWHRTFLRNDQLCREWPQATTRFNSTFCATKREESFTSTSIARTEAADPRNYQVKLFSKQPQPLPCTERRNRGDSQPARQARLAFLINNLNWVRRTRNVFFNNNIFHDLYLYTRVHLRSDIHNILLTPALLCHKKNTECILLGSLGCTALGVPSHGIREQASVKKYICRWWWDCLSLYLVFQALRGSASGCQWSSTPVTQLTWGRKSQGESSSMVEIFHSWNFTTLWLCKVQC